MPSLYRGKIRDLDQPIRRQLYRLNNGMYGHLYAILKTEKDAEVYYWIADGKVVSWATYSEDWNYSGEQYDRVMLINLYTDPEYRGQGYAGEIIDQIKKDFKQDFKDKVVYGYSQYTSLIKRHKLRDM